MTEAVVRFVVGKLGDVIVNESLLLGGVGKKVKRMQRDLIRIQCCLEDADSKRKGDARVQNWLNELRDVAYRIEDAIETFFLQVEDNSQKESKDATFLPKLKKLCTRPLMMPILHNLGIEIDDIQNELEDIYKSKVDFGIIELQDKSKQEAAVIMPFRRAAYSEVDETEVVGLLSDKGNILKLLRMEKTPRRAVITIVGPGGLGKTTLAHMVYKSARAEFGYHIMLSISQQFSLIDLLRKMLRQLQYSIPDNQDVGDLINKLKDLLSSRRYLIILDDVWEVDLWYQLKEALPDVNNRSRVMVTSRFVNVARSADPNMEPYELRFLNDRESRDLLLKKALCSQRPDKDCPSDLLELADELSKKCKGLPLALIVVGGILSTKERSYPAWNRVLRTLNWHSEGKDCMQVLAMSYEDMPYYLKACFLYLASFPEDYTISANRVIHMWVAEGFIPREGSITMEETAEVYLEELFQRCMVQVTRRFMHGSIKYFQVHDLLRDLAVQEAKQQNFVTIVSEASDVNQPNNRGTRRASFQYCSPQSMKYVGPNTRSILLFNMEVPKYSHLRQLKVLELVHLNISTDVLFREFEELIHLKYLGIIRCKYAVSLCSFRGMKALETLNIQGTCVERFEALWTISTLRHVLYYSHTFDETFLEGPTSKDDLKNLQTLKWIDVPRTWAKELPRLDNLCNLGIICEFNDWVLLTNLLGTLQSLVHLSLYTPVRYSKRDVQFPQEIIYPSALPNYRNLQSLYLNGGWSETVTLEARLFPPHLVKLKLCFSDLKQDPMFELGKLKSLKKLSLEDVWSESYSVTTIFCPPGFPVLQYLRLDVEDGRMEEFKVAQGAMPKLTNLKLRTPAKLYLPPELQHVTVVRSYIYS